MRRWLPGLLLCGIGCGSEPPAAPAIDAGSRDAAAAVQIADPAPAALPALGPCPVGWAEVADDEIPICEPPAPAACDGAGAAFLGETACAPVGGACPTGDFPDDLPAGPGVLFVSASAAAGGDGTRERPLSTIAAAMAAAADGTTVALARGTYDELVELRPGVTLRGACADETVLAPSTTELAASRAVVLARFGRAELRDVRIAGVPRIGIAVAGPAELALDGVVVQDAIEHGLVATSGGRATGRSIVVRRIAPNARGANGQAVAAASGATIELERVLLEDAGPSLVFVDGASSAVRLSDALLRRPRVDAASRLGRAALVGAGAEASFARALVTGTRGIAFHARGIGARVVLDQVVLRDAFEEDGLGIAAGEGARAEVTRTRIDGFRGMAVYVPDGELTMTDVVVRDPSFVAMAPSAIAIVRESVADLARVAVLRAAGVGLVVARPGARAHVEDLVVRDTTFARDEVTGQPLWVLDGASLELARAELIDNEGGPIVATHATATIEDLVVRTTRGEAPGQLGGIGLTISDLATVTLARARIESTRVQGLFADMGSDLRATDLVVESTLDRYCTGECLDGAYGSGVAAAAGARVDVERFRIANNTLCGVRVLAGGAIDLRHGEIAGNVIGVNIEDPSFDASRVTTDVAFVGNERTLDAAALPIPMPALPTFGG